MSEKRQHTLEGELAEPNSSECHPKCYTAKKEKCSCKCGGFYHGRGLEKREEEA